MAKKAIFHRLNDARTAHASYAAQITEKKKERESALLAGATVAAIAKIDNELAILQHAADTEAARIRLLEVEVAKEKQAEVAKRQQAHLDRHAKIQRERIELAAKVQADVTALWNDVRELTEVSDRALMMYAVHSASAHAGAQAIEGAAMSPEAITSLLASEFFRQSADPFLGGAPGERRKPSLPGAKSPRIELSLQPGKVTPFAERLKVASEYAIATLKVEIRAPGEFKDEAGAVAAPIAPQPSPTPLRSATEIQLEIQRDAETRDAAFARANGKASANGAEPRERTPAQVAYSELLSQANEAAKDTSELGEKKYFEIIAQIPAAEAAAKASLERTT